MHFVSALSLLSYLMMGRDGRRVSSQSEHYLWVSSPHKHRFVLNPPVWLFLCSVSVRKRNGNIYLFTSFSVVVVSVDLSCEV